MCLIAQTEARPATKVLLLDVHAFPTANNGGRSSTHAKGIIMQLKEIMTSAVHTVVPGCSLVDAAKQMESCDIGWLPVSTGKKVVGIITDRDIAIRAIAKGLDSSRTKVEDVMTREVFSCRSDSSVSDVCNLMENKQVRRLVIKDGNDDLCGIVSLADVALQTDDAQSGEVLKKVSQPS